VVAGYFALPANIQDRIKSITRLDIRYSEKAGIYDSSQSRILIWTSGVKIIRDYPFGIGQGNIGEVFPRYHLQSLGEPTEPHLHNNFLQITAQNGWQGLAVYLGWIFCFFLYALRYRGREPLDQELNWTMTCCFLASLVWGLTEFTFAQQFMYLQFSMLGLQMGLWKKEGLFSPVQG
jgi:O-antigen ligase